MTPASLRKAVSDQDDLRGSQRGKGLRSDGFHALTPERLADERSTAVECGAYALSLVRRDYALAYFDDPVPIGVALTAANAEEASIRQ